MKEYFTKQKGIEIRDSIKNSTTFKVIKNTSTIIGFYVICTFCNLMIQEAMKFNLNIIKVEETTTISKSTTPKAASAALGLPKKEVITEEIKIPEKEINKSLERDLSHIKISDKFPKELIELIPIAEQERIKYGIPISITISQMYLESGIRDNKPPSELALVYNNWFGIKAQKSFMKTLKKHGIKVKSTPRLCNSKGKDCAKYIWFNSRWDCLRSKSIMIRGQRYRNVQGDYKEFAKGLKLAGYATDKNYHKKLIQTIEKFKLHKYDK